MSSDDIDSRKFMLKVGAVLAVTLILVLGVGAVLMRHKNNSMSTMGRMSTASSASRDQQVQSADSGGLISGTRLAVMPASSIVVSANDVNKVAVQRLAVYDGVSADVAPSSGSKYEAVFMRITNENTNGTAAPNEVFQQDMTLYGSDGQPYHAFSGDNSSKNCPDVTAPNDQAGQMVEGCLRFMVPATIMPTKLSLNYQKADSSYNPWPNAEASWAIAKP